MSHFLRLSQIVTHNVMSSKIRKHVIIKESTAFSDEDDVPLSELVPKRMSICEYEYQNSTSNVIDGDISIVLSP